MFSSICQKHLKTLFNCFKVHVVEIGANLGDCSVWLAAALLSPYSRRQPDLSRSHTDSWDCLHIENIETFVFAGFLPISWKHRASKVREFSTLQETSSECMWMSLSIFVHWHPFIFPSVFLSGSEQCMKAETLKQWEQGTSLKITILMMFASVAKSVSKRLNAYIFWCLWGKTYAGSSRSSSYQGWLGLKKAKHGEME